QPIITVADIEHANLDLRMAMEETIASKEVKVPKLLVCEGGAIARTALHIPCGFGAGKKTGAMINKSEEGQLMERGFVVRLGALGQSHRDFREARQQLGLAQPITATDGPGIT